MVNYYKKQVEVAREFGVSEGTVTNWIKGGEEGKNKLQLIEFDGKKRIVKNEHNRVEMLNLTDSGKKFRPEDDFIDIEVSDELYDILSENQILSLINSLTVNHEVPFKYVFMGKGGKLWDEFYNDTQVDKDYGGSALDYLLYKSFSFLEKYFERFDLINIVDVGAGNGKPIIELIKELHASKKLNKYIAVDISKTCLDIAKKNVSTIIPAEYIETVVQDVEIESFQSILYKHKKYDSDKKTANIILVLGGTLGNCGLLQNQIKALMNIRDGLFPEDYLIVTDGYDTVNNRTIFPTVDIPKGNQHAMYITRLLGIKDEYCEELRIYNEETETREYKLMLSTGVNIKFTRLNTVVKLPKNTKINVWKHRRDTFESITTKMKESGMGLEYISKHPVDPIVLFMGKVL